MNLPKRKKRVRSGIRDEDGPIRCQGHLKWIRGHECCVCSSGGQFTKTEAHHLQSFRAVEGGMGLKVGDDKTVPLCGIHHAEIHSDGQTQFERHYKRPLETIAAELWRISPHGVKYRSQAT